MPPTGNPDRKRHLDAAVPARFIATPIDIGRLERLLARFLESPSAMVFLGDQWLLRAPRWGAGSMSQFLPTK